MGRMLTDQDIADLKSKNPGANLAIIENEIVAPGESFVIKIDPAVWDRFVSMRANEEMVPGAVKTFVLGIAVKPNAEELLMRLQTSPGLLDTIAKEAIKLHGASAASTSRKI